jgi:hypothetical protein
MSDTSEPTIQQLRERADRAATLERETAEKDRRIAFLEAGINPTADPKLNYFVAGYKGDLTPEAIRAEAEAAGFLTPLTAAPVEGAEPAEPTGPTEEQQAQDLMATSVASEAVPGGSLPPKKDLVVDAWDEFSDRRKSGADLEEASAPVIHALVAKGLGIDPRGGTS